MRDILASIRDQEEEENEKDQLSVLEPYSSFLQDRSSTMVAPISNDHLLSLLSFAEEIGVRRMVEEIAEELIEVRRRRQATEEYVARLQQVAAAADSAWRHAADMEMTHRPKLGREPRPPPTRTVQRRILKTRTVPRRTMLSDMLEQNQDVEDVDFDDLIEQIRLPVWMEEEYSEYEEYEEEVFEEEESDDEEEFEDGFEEDVIAAIEDTEPTALLETAAQEFESTQDCDFLFLNIPQTMPTSRIDFDSAYSLPGAKKARKRKNRKWELLDVSFARHSASNQAGSDPLSWRNIIVECEDDEELEDLDLQVLEAANEEWETVGYGIDTDPWNFSDESSEEGDDLEADEFWLLLESNENDCDPNEVDETLNYNGDEVTEHRVENSGLGLFEVPNLDLAEVVEDELDDKKQLLQTGSSIRHGLPDCGQEIIEETGDSSFLATIWKWSPFRMIHQRMERGSNSASLFPTSINYNWNLNEDPREEAPETGVSDNTEDEEVQPWQQRADLGILRPSRLPFRRKLFRFWSPFGMFGNGENERFDDEQAELSTSDKAEAEAATAELSTIEDLNEIEDDFNEMFLGEGAVDDGLVGRHYRSPPPPPPPPPLPYQSATGQPYFPYRSH